MSDNLAQNNPAPVTVMMSVTEIDEMCAAVLLARIPPETVFGEVIRGVRSSAFGTIGANDHRAILQRMEREQR